LYDVTPQTALPPRFKVYEIYSKFLKHLFWHTVSPIAMNTLIFCQQH